MSLSEGLTDGAVKEWRWGGKEIIRRESEGETEKENKI